MDAPLFDIDIPGMQATVNKFQPGTGLAWATLFPLKYTRKFDIKGLEGDEGIPVAADRVAFNTKAPKKTRQKVGTWSGKLSKYAVSRDKDEVEINEYLDAQTLANSATENQQEKQELVNLVYDDVTFVRKAMDYKVELDCMRIASSGVQTFPAKIEGDMATQDTINFNVPAANFIGVSISEKKSKDGKTYLAHTLNNTCVAPPRMLIAFLENHLQADGTVTIPEVLRPYMGGKAVLVPNKK